MIPHITPKPYIKIHIKQTLMFLNHTSIYIYMLDKHKHCVTENTSTKTQVTSMFEDDLHYAKKQVGFQIDF